MAAIVQRENLKRIPLFQSNELCGHVQIVRIPLSYNRSILCSHLPFLQGRCVLAAEPVGVSIKRTLRAFSRQVACHQAPVANSSNCFSGYPDPVQNSHGIQQELYCPGPGKKVYFRQRHKAG